MLHWHLHFQLNWIDFGCWAMHFKRFDHLAVLQCEFRLIFSQINECDTMLCIVHLRTMLIHASCANTNIHFIVYTVIAYKWQMVTKFWRGSIWPGGYIFYILLCYRVYVLVYSIDRWQLGKVSAVWHNKINKQFIDARALREPPFFTRISTYT